MARKSARGSFPLAVGTPMNLAATAQFMASSTVSMRAGGSVTPVSRRMPSKTSVLPSNWVSLNPGSLSSEPVFIGLPEPASVNSAATIATAAAPIHMRLEANK